MEQKQSDVLVLFGPLATSRTRRSFRRCMVQSGRLEVPVIGVARESWTVEQRCGHVPETVSSSTAVV